MTPKERAASIIEAQGDDLTRYQRMFLAQDIEKEITEAIEEAAAALDTALASILQERARQDSKWGQQNHDPFTYLTILTEEVGELAQAALHARFGGSKAAGLREEAVHTAAVALAIVQCLDRGKWVWPQVAGDYKQD